MIVSTFSSFQITLSCSLSTSSNLTMSSFTFLGIVGRVASTEIIVRSCSLFLTAVIIFLGKFLSIPFEILSSVSMSASEEKIETSDDSLLLVGGIIVSICLVKLLLLFFLLGLCSNGSASFLVWLLFSMIIFLFSELCRFMVSFVLFLFDTFFA